MFIAYIVWGKFKIVNSIRSFISFICRNIGLESMAPSMRHLFLCTVLGAQPIGGLLSGLMAYYIRDWQNLQLCICIVLTISVVSFL